MKGNGLNSRFKTASEVDVTEQRAVIKFCVVADKTNFEAKQLLEEVRIDKKKYHDHWYASGINDLMTKLDDVKLTKSQKDLQLLILT